MEGQEQLRRDFMALQDKHNSLENTVKSFETQLVKLTDTVERSITSAAERLSKLELFKNNIFSILGASIFTALIFGGEKAWPIVEKILLLFLKAHGGG